VIRRNPFIKKIEVTGCSLPAGCLEILSQALASLPALEHITLKRGVWVAGQPSAPTTMPLHLLLQARSLQSLTFGTRFNIRREVVQHLLVALNGSTVTRLKFEG
jgi:hypothetical protein